MSCVKRLFDTNYHPWKNIPLKLIQNKFGCELFHANSKWTFDNDFPKFYQKIAKNQSKLAKEPLTVTNILSQRIWLNSFIQIANQPINALFQFECFIDDFYENGLLIPFETFKITYNLSNRDFFKWRQIVSAIPLAWKNKLCEPSPSELNKVLPTGSPPNRYIKFLFITQLKRQLPNAKFNKFQKSK